MRTRTDGVALALFLLCACGSEENYVLSGYPPIIISPVRSAMHAQMNFRDTSGATHPQWVIVLTDAGDVCTKLATHQDYFQNAIEGFNAVIVWVPPNTIGTWFIGQDDGKGSVAGTEVLSGIPPSDAGTAQVVRLPQTLVPGVGEPISITEFNASGGQAVGNFDVLVSAPGGGGPREYAGKFKTSYCAAMATAQLP
jgi:hypothetical protein